MSFSDSLRGERSPGEPARQESEESASSVHPPPVKHTRRKIITGAIAAGSLLALGTGGYLDLAANWQRLTLPPLTTTDLGAINALVWSPDGKYIALAKTPETVILSDLTYTDVGTYGLQVWDADGSRLRMSHQTDDVIGSLSWSPDSKWLAAPVGNRVQILAGSGAGGKDGTPPVAQIAGVTSLPEGEDTSNRNVAAWSPDGTRLAFSHFGVSKKTGQATGVLSLWDFSRHQVLWQTTQQGNWFWTLSWSPDSQHLALSSEDEPRWIGVVDARNGQAILDLGPEQEMNPHELASSVWSPDGRFIAIGYTLTGDGSRGKVSIRDAHTGRQVTAYFVEGARDNGPMITMVAWSPDSRYLAVIGNMDRIRGWDLTTDTLAFTCPPAPGTGMHTQPTSVLAWSPNGKHLVSAVDGTYIRIWDVP